MHTKLYQFFEALSLSGAVIMLFFTLTVTGIIMHEEKVWSNFGTALTTFVSGKRLGENEAFKQLTQPPPDKKPEGK